MSKFIQGAQALERLALHYKDMSEAHELLTELGKAEQLQKQYESAASKFKSEAEKQKKALDSAKAKLTEVEAACADREAQTTTRCNELVDSARHEAHTLKDKANLEALQIVADAKKEAAEVLAKKQETASDLDATIKALEEGRDAVQDQIIVAKKELEAVEARLAKAKAAAQKAARQLIGE